MNTQGTSQRFRKTGSPRALAFEVAGLAELGQAAQVGGAPCAQVVGSGPGFIETASILHGPVTREAARNFGAALARTHAFAGDDGASADAGNWSADAVTRVFGQAPAGFGAEWEWNGFMGAAGLPLVPPGSVARRFGEFYAEDRLLPYARIGYERGALIDSDLELLDQLAQRLHDGVFDSPQPALVRTDAALLHGDLWCGNVLWAANRGSEPAGTLIDPACHGGHAESDLAQLTVFHQEYVGDIYAGYHEASALADGWEERIGLHQLHIVLVHVALFGVSYTPKTMRTVRKYL